jgi:hypothetical protein
VRDHPIPFVLDHWLVSWDTDANRFVFRTKGGIEASWRDLVHVLRREFPSMLGRYGNPFSYVIAHLHALQRAGEL